MSFGNAGYGPAVLSSDYGGKYISKNIQIGGKRYSASELGFKEPDRSAKRQRRVFPVSKERVRARIGSASQGEFNHPPPSSTKKANGTTGPLGANTTLSTNNQIRLNKSRTQPIPYQQSIVNIGNFTRPQVLFDIRRQNWERCKNREEDLVAPLGTPDCFVVRKGCLVYSLAGSTPVAPRPSDARNAYVTVFDCVNALYKWDSLVFQGAGLFNLRADHPDGAGTFQSGGTVTTWNTGPGVLRVAETAYASIIPHTVRNDKNQLVPATPVLGVPGELREKDPFTGVSKAKFFPAIYPLKGNDNDAYMLSLENDIEKLWDEHDVEHVTPRNVNDKIKEMLFSMEARLFSHAAKDLPARQYASAYAVQYLFLRHSGSNSDSDHAEYGIGMAVLKKIEKEFRKMNEMSVKFHGNLGMNGMPFTHPLLTPELRYLFDDEENWTQQRKIIEGYAAHAAVFKYSQELCNYERGNQQQFLRRSTVGSILADSLSGSSVDINMGHTFHC